MGYEMSISHPLPTHYFIHENKPSKLVWARSYPLDDVSEGTDEMHLANISLRNHVLVVGFFVGGVGCFPPGKKLPFEPHFFFFFLAPPPPPPPSPPPARAQRKYARCFLPGITDW